MRHAPRGRVARRAVLTLAALGLLAPPAGAQPPVPAPYQADDATGFHSILPPGTRGRYSLTELAARYGFTPEPTHIEVFRRWTDFSVRSTGFEGFPALGVCFGPVVTAVSPLSELRGSFSWARTSFHEYTHVIHLGLSHNRCPRWITEGLATLERVTIRFYRSGAAGTERPARS